jgi:hypothetical protein
MTGKFVEEREVEKDKINRYCSYIRTQLSS